MGGNKASIKEFYLLKLLSSLSLAVETRFKIIQVFGAVLLLAHRSSSQASRAVFGVSWRKQKGKSIINSRICLCAIYASIYSRRDCF